MRGLLRCEWCWRWQVWHRSCLPRRRRIYQNFAHRLSQSMDALHSRWPPFSCTTTRSILLSEDNDDLQSFHHVPTTSRAYDCSLSSKMLITSQDAPCAVYWSINNGSAAFQQIIARPDVFQEDSSSQTSQLFERIPNCFVLGIIRIGDLCCMQWCAIFSAVVLRFPGTHARKWLPTNHSTQPVCWLNCIHTRHIMNILNNYQMILQAPQNTVVCRCVYSQVLCKLSGLPLLHHCNRPSTPVEEEFPIPWVEYLLYDLLAKASYWETLGSLRKRLIECIQY